MKSLRGIAGAKVIVLWPLSALSLSALSLSASLGVCAPSVAAPTTKPHTAKPPKPAAPSPGALAFHVNARFRYHDDEGEDAPGDSPEDSLDAKVLVQGQRARLETTVGGRPLLVIVAPPFLYKLLPAAKSGTRYRLDAVSKNPRMAGLNPQPWLRDPQAIRAALSKQSAHRAGEAVLDGVPVEIWTAPQFMGRSGQVKAWLRRADALPVKLEVQSKALTATATWRDYQRIGVPGGAPFSPPAGFRIREAE